MNDFDDKARGFSHVLVEDVIINHHRFSEQDSPTHRRDLVRAIFSGIDGLIWDFKQAVRRHAGVMGQLSPHELSALLEEAYSIDSHGNIHVQGRYFPTGATIRFVVKILQRCRPLYTVEFNHPGWSKLKSSITVRNRIVHPKRIEDQNVSDEELADCLSGFTWLLALALEMREEILDDYKRVRSLTKSECAEGSSESGLDDMKESL